MEDLQQLTEAAAACGLELQAQQIEPEHAECWPDNWLPMQVLQAMATQWRTSQHGHVLGLHYEALPGVLQMMDVPRKRRADVFWALRQMEGELIPWFNRDRKAG